MKKRVIYIFTILIFTMFAFSTKSQTILRDTLSYKIVDEIDTSNDSLVDNEEYPMWRNETNLIIENVALQIDTSWWTNEITEIVNQWKAKNNIKDDGETSYYYGLIKENENKYSVKKLTGKVNYLFGEIGGGYKVERIIGIKENNVGEVLCLFDKSIKLEEKEVQLQFIQPSQPIKFPNESLNREKILEKNVKFGFEITNIKYDLSYTADLSQNGFSYGGFGTIYPTYFNVELKLVDKNSGIEQVLFKYPHSNYYNISEIILGDIDNDSQPDIIYKICDEICIRRVVFLSSKKESNQLMKYIGQTKISCWDP